MESKPSHLKIMKGWGHNQSFLTLFAFRVCYNSLYLFKTEPGRSVEKCPQGQDFSLMYLQRALRFFHPVDAHWSSPKFACSYLCVSDSFHLECNDD